MRIGILGGGQLGRMLALSGYPLGLQFRIFDRSPGCAAEVTHDFIEGDYEDQRALECFVKEVDVVTTEFENVPITAADIIEKLGVPFCPGREPLRVSQDRLFEKQLFDQLSVPTTKYVSVESAQALSQAMTEVGFPCVVKTRRLGYDGKGQRVLKEPVNEVALWEELGETPLLVEECVAFQREVSQILVRDRNGAIVFYPLAENVHNAGILSQTIVPAEGLVQQAQETGKRIAEHFQYVGVLTIEFFEREGQLIANELAPRVHNSGHWSQNGGVPSQFENHVRAIAGLPLAPVELEGYVGMVNLIGTVPDRREIAAISHARLHLYNKTPVTGRKIGHINTAASSRKDLEAQLKEIRQLTVNW